MTVKRETWGNNEWHYPDLCEDCDGDCRFCSNGPRGEAYQRAEAESRMKDMWYESQQWSGLDEC